MEIIHTVADPSKNIKKILKDGFLRPSIKTKNIQMYAMKEGSKYNYLRFKFDNDQISATLTLSPEFLLNTPFYLNIGWLKYPTGEPIIVKTLEELEKIKKYVEKNRNKKIPIAFSHEILFEDNIDLHKYLIKALVPKKILKYAEKEYPNVKFTVF